MVALTMQADNGMQETRASVKATILKAGYVLAPILQPVLMVYRIATDFIPAGYYSDYAFDWTLVVFTAQIVVLIWVRKLPALVSLIISILALFIVFFADGLVDISYQSFAMANSPLEQYKDKCVTVPYFDGRPETLGYCQTIRKAGQGFGEDIMMDSGGWITVDDARRPPAWNKALGMLATTATHSELFQVNELEVVDDDSMRANEMGHGFYVVWYSDDEDY